MNAAEHAADMACSLFMWKQLRGWGDQEIWVTEVVCCCVRVSKQDVGFPIRCASHTVAWPPMLQTINMCYRQSAVMLAPQLTRKETTNV